jgi:hypothetical protein
MVSKKVLALTAGVVLSMTAVSALADGTLTLTGQNLPGNVSVVCNGKPALFPIPQNGSLSNLPYSLVRAMFFGSISGPAVVTKCNFTVNSQLAGSAKVSIGATNNHMQVLKVTPATGYAVTVASNGQTVSVPTGAIANMSVTLSSTSK